jgi:hypothetical protein
MENGLQAKLELRPSFLWDFTRPIGRQVVTDVAGEIVGSFPEDGTYVLSRNAGNQLPNYFAS